MPRSIGDRLPAGLRSFLDGTDLRGGEGRTFLLVTSGPDWPHVAMLSVGEVLATNDREIRIALWPGTTSTANLTASGRAVLMAIVDDAVHFVRLACRRGADLELSQGKRAFVIASVADVLEDRVTYAQMTSALAFRLVDREATIPRWEETIAALRRGH